jgi:uncharacterized protein YerC
MITETDSKRITKMIEAGMRIKEIVRTTGIARNTVRRVVREYRLLSTITSEQEAQVSKLLKVGLPVGAVEAETKIPRLAVTALKRKTAKPADQKKEDAVECGLVFLTTPNDSPSVRRLCDIVADVANLGNLHLISHPLFYQLARRAKKLMEKINANETV